MKINKLVTALLLTCLLLTGLIISCDLQEASGELHGKWVAYGGLSLEFNNGRFTKVIPGGEVQSGTYVTDGKNILFHRVGYTSEKLPYSLVFPRLIVDGVTYFHDSPRLPDDVSGMWFGFYSINSSLWPVASIIYSPASPVRGNPWVYEGTYYITGSSRGIYSVSARNMPSAGKFSMTMTHVYGGDLAVFIRYRLPVHIMELFDWDSLGSSFAPDYWWFTLDEARQFFLDAIQRAGGDLAIERQILNVMFNYFSGMGDTTVYDYTLTEYDDIIYDLWGEEIEGNLVLTFRFNRGIITFVNANVMDILNHHHERLVDNCDCIVTTSSGLVGCECPIGGGKDVD
jgi:hypothetical protein